MCAYNDLYQSIKAQFQQSGIETPDLDARVLICEYAGFDQADFIVSGDKSVDKSVEEKINAAVQKRLSGMPISKILGKREFWALDFMVTADTLSPRPETEIIVERVLNWAKEQEREHDDLSLLDLGTGTACLPIAILSELKNARAIAADKSEKALKVAQQNAENHKMGSRIDFVQSDWFSNLGDKKFDIIVSNPPYIAESDRESLPIEVKNHDPEMALFGGVHGLDPYKIIFSKLNSHLNKAGRAFFEIGQNQLDDVLRLVDDSNLQHCDSIADLVGIPRVVEISCGDK